MKKILYIQTTQSWLCLYSYDIKTAQAIDENEGETKVALGIMMAFTIQKTWFMKEIINGIDFIKNCKYLLYVKHYQK